MSFNMKNLAFTVLLLFAHKVLVFCQNKNSIDNCQIEILILHNSDKALINMDSIANVAILQINQALTNSKIEHSVKLCPVLKYGLFESKTIEESLASIQKDASIIQLRKKYKADIVFFISQKKYGNTLGLSFHNATSKTAFGIVQLDSLLTNYTLVHEFGHILGADHEIEASDSQSGYAHGIKRESQTCIMHTICKDAVRKLYFSNPEIVLKGKRFGIENQCDNSRKIREKACIVASFN